MMVLRKKLPPKGFTVVIQPPFVVIGDDSLGEQTGDRVLRAGLNRCATKQFFESVCRALLLGYDMQNTWIEGNNGRYSVPKAPGIRGESNITIAGLERIESRRRSFWQWNEVDLQARVFLNEFHDSLSNDLIHRQCRHDHVNFS